MKATLRILALFLSVVMVLTVGLVGCKKTDDSVNFTPVDVTTEFEPLHGIQSNWLNTNPDRGYRSEFVFAMLLISSVCKNFQFK